MTPFQIKWLIDLTARKNKFTFVLCLLFFELVWSLINCQICCDPLILYIIIQPIWKHLDVSLLGKAKNKCKLLQTYFTMAIYPKGSFLSKVHLCNKKKLDRVGHQNKHQQHNSTPYLVCSIRVMQKYKIYSQVYLVNYCLFIYSAWIHRFWGSCDYKNWNNCPLKAASRSQLYECDELMHTPTWWIYNDKNWGLSIASYLFLWACRGELWRVGKSSGLSSQFASNFHSLILNDQCIIFILLSTKLLSSWIVLD